MLFNLIMQQHQPRRGANNMVKYKAVTIGQGVMDELNCLQGGWLDAWGGFHGKQLSNQSPFVSNTFHLNY